jgi:hypothetical protein
MLGSVNNNRIRLFIIKRTRLPASEENFVARVESFGTITPHEARGCKMAKVR